MTTQPEQAQRSIGDKIQLILIFAIPVVGLLLMTAYYLYVTSEHIQTGTHNYGTLITPPKQSLDLALTEEGLEAKLANYDERWSFVVAQYGACLEECQRKLYLTRQIQAAMGKYGPRIENVYLQLGDLPVESAALFAEGGDYHGHKVLVANAEQAKQWFSAAEPVLNLGDADFYVVDPRGWVMMYYGKNNSYKEVIKDMKFLLKNS
jgi:cytochrome oxidase Cu insertion factor (SCO1/SenC/PrrC family)